jgi:hypothetical protein
MRSIFHLLLILPLLVACKLTDTNTATQSDPMLEPVVPPVSAPLVELKEAYFVNQVGGTPDAGVSQIFYIRVHHFVRGLTDFKLEVAGHTVNLRAIKPEGSGLYGGSLEFDSNDQIIAEEELEASLHFLEGEKEHQLDIPRLALRETIYMPAAIPQR